MREKLFSWQNLVTVFRSQFVFHHSLNSWTQSEKIPLLIFRLFLTLPMTTVFILPWSTKGKLTLKLLIKALYHFIIRYPMLWKKLMRNQDTSIIQHQPHIHLDQKYSDQKPNPPCSSILRILHLTTKESLYSLVMTMASKTTFLHLLFSHRLVLLLHRCVIWHPCWNFIYQL